MFHWYDWFHLTFSAYFLWNVFNFLCPMWFEDHKTWQTLEMKASLIWHISTNCKICNSPPGPLPLVGSKSEALIKTTFYESVCTFARKQILPYFSNSHLKIAQILVTKIVLLFSILTADKLNRVHIRLSAIRWATFLRFNICSVQLESWSGQFLSLLGFQNQLNGNLKM